MTEKSRPDALVAKNQSDFDAMTHAVKSALKKIESDRRLKPTQATLAKLAGCTRGTLNNRGWPLTALIAIKTARRQKQESERLSEPKATVAEPESEVDRLEKQLQLSRDENARLHDKNELLRKELQQAKDLLAEVTRLTRNTRQDATPSKPAPASGQVVTFREKAVAKSGQGTGPSRR